MKTKTGIVRLLFTLALSASSGLSAERSPVLLELFTSQSCSSCPPAEALLTRLSQDQPVPGIEIIPLAYHVDYWNQLGWSDRYSRAAFTDRQYAYAQTLGLEGVFTPQAVISGSASEVGSDEHAILKRLSPLRRLALHWAAPTLTVTGLSAGRQVWIAVAEDGLSTPVGGGENGGRVLAQSAVVRELVRGNAAGSSLQMTLNLDPAWIRGNLRLVAFQSEIECGPVFAAGQLKLK